MPTKLRAAQDSVGSILLFKFTFAAGKKEPGSLPLLAEGLPSNEARANKPFPG